MILAEKLTDLTEGLVDQHSSMLLSYLSALLGSQTLAEDVVQDVFVRVIQKIHTFDPDKGSFPVWIRTIGRNMAFNLMRSKKREVLIDAQEIEGIEDVFTALDEYQRNDGQQELWDDKIQMLRQCMTHLSDPMSDTCRMFYYNKKKTADIADALQVTQSLVLKRLERARGSLRVCIEGKLQLEDAL
jgi:RNA polymerase sigma factor (sigma-70 family)